ncbi:MAG: 50S ribosomal protein L6 [Elusimicrobia bacterium]|nr:50S ribosomal protein L6 [Elusimicrobiota bacterium]
MPVVVPQGVQVTITQGKVTAKGPKGQLEQPLPDGIKAELKDGKVLLTSAGGKELSAMYGMSRARVHNIVEGVQHGFTKVLDVVGLGFKAAIAGDKLTLNLGWSHPYDFFVPKGVTVTVDPKTQAITLTGADKDVVGQTAASIRAIKPPEPYKGTGIRYRGEHIVKKAGKTAAGVGGGAAGGGAKK